MPRPKSPNRCSHPDCRRAKAPGEEWCTDHVDNHEAIPRRERFLAATIKAGGESYGPQIKAAKRGTCCLCSKPIYLSDKIRSARSRPGEWAHVLCIAYKRWGNEKRAKKAAS